MIVAALHEAQLAGAPLGAVCQVVGVSARTIQRWKRHASAIRDHLRPRACSRPRMPDAYNGSHAARRAAASCSSWFQLTKTRLASSVVTPS